MVTVNEKEIEALREITKHHIRQIIGDTDKLLKYMEVANISDIFTAVLGLYMSLKILEEEKKEEEK